MKKVIKVEISYFDFYFEDIEEAVKFADTAARTIDKDEEDKRISVHVVFIKEDENEVQKA